ncbi:hypothetical protein R1sor_007662 [Riccia sorocarpa]|uniref:Uncharacterized protein n=1 Tax=Riccia sorocarpa TaxID=122646 RepID=A0ABD3HTA4_9MARC
MITSIKLRNRSEKYRILSCEAKFHHLESNDVDDDIRPWLAQWSLWSALELISRDIVSKIFHKRLSREDSAEDKIDEAIEKFRLYFIETRDNFWSSLWFPVDDMQDVNVNIKRAKRIVFSFFVWHLQVEKAPSCFQKWREVDDEYSMYTKKDTFSRDLDALSDWEILNSPWWIDQRTESPKFVADAETLCWEKIQKEEESFDVSKDKFEDSDKKGQLQEARHLEPSPNIDGLVVDTSRTKKQKESKMKKSEDVEDEEGQTPKGKPKPAKNPGSGRSSRTKKGKEKEETTKETSKDRRKKKDQSDEETVQVSQQQPTSNDAMEVQPVSATPTVEEQPEPATVREEGRQRKRANKLIDGVRLYEGFFRADQFIDIPNQFAVLKTSLKSTVDILHANKTRTKKFPVPIIDELKKMCTAVAPMRMAGFLLNKKQVSFAADCLYLDLPSGLNLDVDDNGPPLWNVYPAEDDLPRKLMTLGKSILDDRGCLIILHSGSLRNTQQIADALDAYCKVWSPVASFDIVNEVPQFQPSRAMKVFHSKVEVFCKWNADFEIPKSACTSFDPENTGRDSVVIYNYNTVVPKKLDDLGIRKCTGFVQTLLENFTKQGDIVIDFAGGWGASMHATFNCSRCCIVAEERKEALESLLMTQSSIAKAKEDFSPASSSQPSSQPDVRATKGKKPLGEDDELGDDIFGEDEHMGDVNFFEVAVGPGQLQAKGTAQKPPVQTKIGRYLSSPAQDFTMPVYAANYALELAKNTTPPSQSRDKGRRQRYFNIPYIDDQAREANDDTVELSSDEDI